MRTIHISDGDEEVISDALTTLWNRAPNRREEIKVVCLAHGLMIESECPDEV